MTSRAATVAEYLASQPPERRSVLETVRQVVRKSLDPVIQEGMQYGMIGYFIPHSVYPAGYHCDPKQPLPFVGLAAQKNHLALYLMCLWSNEADEAWFRTAWAKAGKKLDMGKCCLRFRRLEDLALEVIAELIRRVPARRFIDRYETVIRPPARPRPARSTRASRSR